MPIPWRTSGDEFAQTLRRHGIDPDAVVDVAAAWLAFGEFLQINIDGLDTPPDADVDGFIVQWGRYSWNGNRLSMSLTRQLAVADPADTDDPDRQPEYWQVSLELTFEDAPSLVILEAGNTADSGFSFEPIGPLRTVALTEMREYEQVQAVWNVTPASSALSFERAC